MSNSRTMTFTLDGQFITNLARERLYQNHDLKAAIDLLLSCTVTDKISESEHYAIAIDILEGRKELRGIYPGDEYGVYDCEPKSSTKTLASLINDMDAQLKRLNDQLQNIGIKVGFMREHLDDYQMASLNKAWHEEMYDSSAEPGEACAEKWLFPDHYSARKSGIGRSALLSGLSEILTTSYPEDTNPETRTSAVNRQIYNIMQAMPELNPDNQTEGITSPVDNYLTGMQHNKGDDYGWLSPTGDFTPVQWGKHQDWAAEYITAHPKLFGLPADNEQELHRISEDMLIESAAGDKLIERGWILMHSPSMGVGLPTGREPFRPTKAQKEFLYDYYTDRNLPAMANKYYE